MNSPSDLPVSRVAAAATEGTRLRDETLLLFPLESLQYLDRDSAVRCQAMLGHGDRFGVWETPPALVGRRISPNIATLSLRERLVRYLPDTPPPLDSFDALIDEGVLWMTRYALLCRMGPAATHKNKGSSLDATSLASNLLQYVSRIVATGIARQLQGAPSEQTGFVGCLTVDDLIELKQVRSIGYDLKRMTMFADRGLWNDAPIKSKLQKTLTQRGVRYLLPRKINPPLTRQSPTTTWPRWGRVSFGWCKTSDLTSSICLKLFPNSSAALTSPNRRTRRLYYADTLIRTSGVTAMANRSLPLRIISRQLAA